MALSDLSNPDFQWDVRGNWTAVYEAIEKRNLALHCANCDPAGAGYPFDAAVDLRTKAEGYNLQLWSTTGFAGPGTINHWFHDLQRAAAGVGAAQVGGAPSWANAQPGTGAGVWVDDASPVGASGFNYLNVTAKCGLNGDWRRKRPREILSATATEDWWGNAAVAGQRAYLQTGTIQGDYAGNSPIYRCVASGNWVIDTDRPHGPPDELDSDNAPATSNHVPYGMFQPGDYFGTHLFDELARRLLALVACTSSIQDPHVTAGQGTSDRQVPVPPGDDPTATATQFAPSEGEAVTRFEEDWHTFTRDPQPVGFGVTNWAFVWNAQMGAATGYDDFGDPGYSLGGIKNFPDGGRIFSTLAGTMHFVWHDVTAATEPWDFDGQGTGLTAGGHVEVGSAGFGAGADATTPVMVIGPTPTPGTPTTAYNSPPAPPPGGPGGNSVTKGCQFTLHLYTVWIF